MKDILEQLRHVDGIPSFLRSMETDRIALAQCIANAADEIERLRNEVKELKGALNEIRNMSQETCLTFEDFQFRVVEIANRNLKHENDHRRAA